MPRKDVTPALILSQAEQLLDIELSAQRATELAVEVQKLNSAVREAADRIGFNDDPARFAAMLSALKGAKK